MKRSRGNKPALIDISDDELPAEKNVKNKAKAVSSQEVAELRQKVAKLEKDLQGVSRYARQLELSMEEAQKRNEFLENLKDKKPDVVYVSDKKREEELEKRLAEMTAQCEEAQKRIEFLENLKDKKPDVVYVSDKKREEELEKRLAELKAQCEDAQKRVEFLENLTDKKPDVVYASNKKREKELQKRLAEVTAQCEFVRKGAADSTIALNHLLALEKQQVREDHMRIDELTYRLAQYEGLPQPLPQYPQQLQHANLLHTQQHQPIHQVPEMYEPPTAPMMSDPSSGLHDTTPINVGPTNILAFLPSSNFSDSIPYRCGAVVQLTSRLHNGIKDEKWNERYKMAVSEEVLQCGCCGEKWRGEQILAHFFSPRHTKKAHSSNVAVSIEAYNYWMRKLESVYISVLRS